MEREHIYDFIIIGSGVSGGRFADVLTRAGAKCLLLEAGKQYDRRTFPPNEMEASAQLFWGGGLEISSSGFLGFLRPKCVGGGSIVNQALVDRFDSNALDDWRLRSDVSYFNTREMEPLYQEAEASISIQTIEERFQNQNAQIFRTAFERCGYEWKQLRRAQSNCRTEDGNDCIVCLGGCPRDSKQSTWVTSIQPALKRGLTLQSDFEVASIETRRDSVLVSGYASIVSPGRKLPEKRAMVFRGAKAVLAAGSIGNTTILLRSGFQRRFSRLGMGFSCHPQYMTYARFKEPVDAHRGAFQAVSSNDSKMRRAGYKFENVYAPPIGTAMLMPGFGRSHQRLMENYRYYASMEVCIRDEPSGVISLSKTGAPIIKKDLTKQDLRRKDEGLSVIRDLFENVGAQEIISGKQGFGLHLMGGCAMGTDGATSVVNPDFQVHDHPRLIVADSSIFPSAPGINPSLTIMALSLKAANALVRDHA